jgi:hypothetical protein
MQSKTPPQLTAQEKEVTMTVRSFLWLVLGIVGLPLLIEGSNGCGFHSC